MKKVTYISKYLMGLLVAGLLIPGCTGNFEELNNNPANLSAEQGNSEDRKSVV